MLNYNLDYFKSNFDYNNNTYNPEKNDFYHYETTQTGFSNNFNQINNSLDILGLTSMKNKTDSTYGVKVKKLSPIPSQNIISSNTRKKILVLDLDETLVHSSIHNPFPNKRNIIFNMYINNIKYKIYVIIRPFFEKFLYEMSLCYNLYIFTSSAPKYSESIIKFLDINKVILQVLNRDYCRNINGIFLKDLSIFNKNFKDIIIVDNNPVSYSINKNNGIPIPTWIDDPNDNELLKLIPILQYLSTVNDVRPIINKIVNKSKDILDYSKVNGILKGKNNLKYKNILTKKMKSKIYRKRIDNNTTLNNNKSSEDSPVKILKENEKKNIQVINKEKKVIKINYDVIKEKINKNIILDKLKLNKNGQIFFNIRKKPPKKIRIYKKNNQIHNIDNTIKENNNILDKINIENKTEFKEGNFKLVHSNTNSDYPKNKFIRYINIESPNNMIKSSKTKNNLHKNFKIFIFKKIQKKLEENETVKEQINKNNHINFKEKKDKFPHDTIKLNNNNKNNNNNNKNNNKKDINTKNEEIFHKEKYLNTVSTEIENELNFESYFSTSNKISRKFSKAKPIIKKAGNSTKYVKLNSESSFNELLQQNKKNRIVVMKIIKNKENKIIGSNTFSNYKTEVNNENDIIRRENNGTLERPNKYNYKTVKTKWHRKKIV